MQTATPSNPSSPDWRWIGFFMTLKLLVQLAALPGYGIFRDELYYLAGTDHLAWGYVDHPPLSVAVLWLWTSLFGEGVSAIRVLPALAGAGVVGTVGWMAARLGGGRSAQCLAMTATLVAPSLLARDHTYSMNSLGMLAWAVAQAILVHIVLGANKRWWIVLGLVLGVGLLNKVDVLWLGVGIGAGLLLSGRRHLKTPGPWIAGALALLVFSPHLIWQQVNGWPTLEFIRNAGGSKMKEIAPLDYLLDQVMAMHPMTFPLWAAGLVFLLVLKRGRPMRVAGWIYPTVLLILLANGTSRTGYLAGTYSLLFAAGSVALTEVFQRIPRLGRFIAPAFVVSLLATGASVAPLALPLLGVESYISYAERLGQKPSTPEEKEIGLLPQFYADMHGWEALARTVDEAVQLLSPEEKSKAAIYAQNYGEASALRYFGRGRAFPPVLSGHNAYWMWGSNLLAKDGPQIEIIIDVGGTEEDIHRLFAEASLVGRTSCRYCMPYENDLPVWIARKPHTPIRDLWPRTRHYD